MKRSAAKVCGEEKISERNFQETSGMKALLLASLSACMVIGLPSAKAVELSDIDLSKKPLDTPTLDYLNRNNVTIPSEDGGAAPVPPSAYTLTRVDGAGENTITKFEWDESTQSFNPVYYKVDLKQTEYGEGNQTHSVTLENGPLKDVTINVHYDDNLTGDYTTEYKDQSLDLSSAGTNIGGAVINNPSGTVIESINNALFENNEVILNSTSSQNIRGGAIYNGGIINTINADFINNGFEGDNIRSAGGAIYNAYNSDISTITGNFVGNSSNYQGGAIANAGNIGSITGKFINNLIVEGSNISGDAANAGGAIFNSGSVTSIDADFIDNIARDMGGAIYNDGEIGQISGNFISNSADGEYSYSGGGAIYNTGTITKISGNFINNTTGASGGAIYSAGYNNDGIGTINADFISNSDSSGGAIYNHRFADIGMIIGDFIGNTVGGAGGAIYNDSEGEIGTIYGDFIANTANGNGGAIYNAGDILGHYTPAITGNFIGNHADGAGGAIYNIGGDDDYQSFYGYIDTISGNFIANTSNSVGGAIANITSVYVSISDSPVIEEIHANFISNSAKRSGGAIYNGGYGSNIGEIKGDFVGNYVEGSNTQGGAIYNTTGWNEYVGNVDGQIGTISGTFTGNYAKSSSGDALGGAIYNEGHIDSYYNISLINNYAESTDGKAQGGAIYSKENVNITADNYNSLFDGNYVKDASGIDSNVIYMAPHVDVESTYKGPTYRTTTATNLNLNAENNGTITINDKINGIGAIRTTTEDDVVIEQDTSVTNYGVNFTGDETGVIYLNNNIEAEDYENTETGEVTEGRADVSLSDVTLHLGVRDDVLNNNNFTVNSGTWNMVNNQTGVAALNSFTVAGDTNFVADVDLLNESMDRITANEYGEHSGNLVVSGMNLLSDAPEDRDVTEIYFAQPGLKDNVLNGVSNGTGDLPDSNQTTFYTPIYKYNAVYDNRADAGYFVFTKGDKIYTPGGEIPGGGTTGGGTIDTGNPSDAFNPAVLTVPVANQAASQAAMTEAFKYVFEHADAFTQLPATERMSYIRQNQYALSSDFNDNLGALSPEFNNKAGWVRPYVTFENMDLKNGPDVDAITYGTLVGFDTDFQDLKRGWYGMTTGYVGYNGSQLSYSGVDASTNGGLLGVTQTFYKGNFWTALTASAGASVGEAQTMYGSEDFTTLLAGVASKTGYNFEFKEGKFILQPIMYISYTFANTFDYTNAAGVKVENDPMHTLQLHPQVRFIMNTKNNWQPYISAGVVWNPFTSSKSTANGIVLPEMSMKPYAEYGIGVQKRWADKYTAFGQAMVRSGGRDGIALTFGFRWNIGKDGTKPNETEEVIKPERKVIKQARK